MSGGNRFSERIADDLQVSGSWRIPARSAAGTPLIVAVPGGSYTARYFDIAGHSLLERAAALGIPAMALDRPGYGETTALPAAEATIARNAEQLDRAIEHLLPRFTATAGVVLIGHSIGGAIAVALAARRPRWPLLGIAISGVGLTPPQEVAAAWASLPEIDMVSLPPEAKDTFMFGPSWTYDAAAPVLTRPADAPTPRAELLDIVTGWPRGIDSLAGAVTVPVHYRLAEFEKLWVATAAEVDRFAAKFSAAPVVDASLYESVGHCIDFHRLGAAFQLEQLAFGLRCSVARP